MPKNVMIVGGVILGAVLLYLALRPSTAPRVPTTTTSTTTGGTSLFAQIVGGVRTLFSPSSTSSGSTWSGSPNTNGPDRYYDAVSGTYYGPGIRV